MRKMILTTSALALLGSAAFAGGPVLIAPDTEVVVEKPASSASGLVVPLLLLVLIAVAASSSGDDDDTAQESDRRLKTDLEWVGMAQGLPVWRYRYLGSAQRFEGVMAQDVQALRPQAVVRRSNGVLAVRYDQLGLTLRAVA
jgi:hypothetical protein